MELTDFYELGSSLPLLEGFLHQRESDKACDFSYHNVILQGSYLRYIAQPLKPKDIGSFRLVLVQGKHKGCMVSISLNMESEINSVTMSAEALSDYPTPYLINLSGKNMNNNGKDVKIQLALPSEEAQLQWLDSLKQAKDYVSICESNGENERLLNLAEEMKEEIGISNRLYQFKIYRKCFVGSKAVRWLVKTKGFTQTQAITIGNKMMYLNIMKEVANQHMFLDKSMLYQFTSDNTGINSSSSTPTKTKSSKAINHINDTENNEETTLDDLLDGILNRGLNENSSPTELLNALRNSEDECARFKGSIRELLKEYNIIHDINTEMMSIVHHVQLSLTIICVVLVLLVCNNYALLSNSDPMMVTNTAITLVASFIVLMNYVTRTKTSKFIIKSLTDPVIHSLDRKCSSNDENKNITMEEAEELMLEKVGLQRIGNKIDDDEGDSDDDNEDYDTLERTPSLDSISELMQKWPNDPIMVRRSPNMIRSDITEQREHLCLPIHIHNKESPELSFISIDSDYFIGKCYLLIAGLKDSPTHFRKRKRKLQAIIQGKFKKDIPFNKVYIGTVFDGAIRQLSAKLLLYNSIKILSKFNPVLNVRMKGEKPYVLTPLVTAAQNIMVSQQGQEPNILFPDELEEDMSLCSAVFKTMSSTKRMQYFSKRSNLDLHSFDSSMVYTFDFYQHLLNVATLDVDLGFLKYDLVKVLGARPLQIMAVIWSPPRLWMGGRSNSNGENENNGGENDNWQYIYNIEVWNKRSTSKIFVNKRNNDRAMIGGGETQGESSE